MITQLSIEAVQCMQLNGFIHVHIQRNGIGFVVENYIPIREQYYAQKYPQQNSDWEVNPNVQYPTR